MLKKIILVMSLLLSFQLSNVNIYAADAGQTQKLVKGEEKAKQAAAKTIEEISQPLLNPALTGNSLRDISDNLLFKQGIWSLPVYVSSTLLDIFAENFAIYFLIVIGFLGWRWAGHGGGQIRNEMITGVGSLAIMALASFWNVSIPANATPEEKGLYTRIEYNGIDPKTQKPKVVEYKQIIKFSTDLINFCENMADDLWVNFLTGVSSSKDKSAIENLKEQLKDKDKIFYSFFASRLAYTLELQKQHQTIDEKGQVNSTPQTTIYDKTIIKERTSQFANNMQVLVPLLQAQKELDEKLISLAYTKTTIAFLFNNPIPNFQPPESTDTQENKKEYNKKLTEINKELDKIKENLLDKELALKMEVINVSKDSVVSINDLKDSYFVIALGNMAQKSLIKLKNSYEQSKYAGKPGKEKAFLDNEITDNTENIKHIYILKDLIKSGVIKNNGNNLLNVIASMPATSIKNTKVTPPVDFFPITESISNITRINSVLLHKWETELETFTSSNKSNDPDTNEFYNLSEKIQLKYLTLIEYFISRKSLSNPVNGKNNYFQILANNKISAFTYLPSDNFNKKNNIQQLPLIYSFYLLTEPMLEATEEQKKIINEFYNETSTGNIFINDFKALKVLSQIETENKSYNISTTPGSNIPLKTTTQQDMTLNEYIAIFTKLNNEYKEVERTREKIVKVLNNEMVDVIEQKLNANALGEALLKPTVAGSNITRIDTLNKQEQSYNEIIRQTMGKNFSWMELGSIYPVLFNNLNGMGMPVYLAYLNSKSFEAAENIVNNPNSADITNTYQLSRFDNDINVISRMNNVVHFLDSVETPLLTAAFATFGVKEGLNLALNKDKNGKISIINMFKSGFSLIGGIANIWYTLIFVPRFLVYMLQNIAPEMIWLYTITAWYVKAALMISIIPLATFMLSIANKRDQLINSFLSVLSIAITPVVLTAIFLIVLELSTVMPIFVNKVIVGQTYEYKKQILKQSLLAEHSISRNVMDIYKDSASKLEIKKMTDTLDEVGLKNSISLSLIDNIGTKADQFASIPLHAKSDSLPMSLLAKGAYIIETGLSFFLDADIKGRQINQNNVNKALGYDDNAAVRLFDLITYLLFDLFISTITLLMSFYMLFQFTKVSEYVTLIIGHGGMQINPDSELQMNKSLQTFKIGV